MNKTLPPLTFLVLWSMASAAWPQVAVTGTNQTGAVPFTPTWVRASGSLIAGLTPTVAAGNFGQYTGANANTLTKPNAPLTIYSYGSPLATNLAVGGNNGTAGSLLVYTLPASTYGYTLTNITVYGGWQDEGRDSQAYTVSYSTVANPGTFILLTQVDYSPSGVPGNTGSANRVVISDASGAAMARNVAALKFDFTTPPTENAAVGYTAITVGGMAEASLAVPPVVIATSNQNSSNSFTPAWPIETNSLIAGKLPGTFGTGNFTIAPGSTGLSALSDGVIGEVGSAANYAMCGTNAGQSVAYYVNAVALTNIVVYSGWQNNGRDGQFYKISYSTRSAPATFIPLIDGVCYNPSVTGYSANRVAITTSTGAPLATNVAFVQFDFTPQSSGWDNGYSGYAEIILQGTQGSSAPPVWGYSPIPEPYPQVSSGTFSGPAVPYSPDPLVAYRWPTPRASDGLEIYLQKPIAVTADTDASFSNLQSLTSTNPIVTVNGTGSILMDFGIENAGWLEFDSPDLTGSVEMSISEYNQPSRVMTGPAHPVKTLSPTKHGNTYRLELNSQLYEGVRFGWIHVRSFASVWHITGIRLVCQTKPANYNGSFSCSDPLLTRIWYTGAYTVKLNLLKNQFGAILMDRGDRFSWTGDAHCSQAASLVAFGNFDFVKQNLDISANDSNGIESYSLYWVLSLIDYYNYSGDATTLGGYINNAVGKLEHAYSIYGTNPNLGFYGWDDRVGAGFENANCPEAQNAYRMLSVRAWKEFAAAMGAYGRLDLQAKYNGYANQKLTDLRQNAGWHQNFGLHAGADAVGTGLLNDTEKGTLFTQRFTDRVNRLSLSPFNQYFVLQALATMNKHDDALSTIDDLWGSEIRYGGTTFFEVSRPSWNGDLGANDPVPNGKCGFTSLCHPWSAGVTKWISEEVLGIKPTSPGFATYQIIPHLGRTLTYVTGKTPTTFGDIQASFNVSNGQCIVIAPAGTVGKVGIPKVEKSISSITINGTLAWDGSSHPVAGIGGAIEDSEFVYLTGVQPGTYSMAAAYSGSTPAFSAPLEQYAAKFIREDSTTSGNWGGIYGKDGYVLCNYNGGGNDKKSLPPYVSSVSYSIWGAEPPHAAIWSAGTSDPRALAADASNQNPRNAACVFTDGYNGGRNTMTCTIHCSSTRKYQVALYFVDWDDRGRRLAVEMHDTSTLDLVAPEKVVTNFHGGKYLIYSYDRSATFRIDQVRGDNAVLSGILFDSTPTIAGAVANDSFEFDVASGAGAVMPTVPSGWNEFNQGAPSDIGSQWAGGVDYTVNTPLAAPAAGQQYCYINMFNPSVTGGIYQDVGALEPNTTYTLTVAIGSRNDRANSPGIISLLNGNNNTGTVLTSGGGLPDAPNTWQDYAVTFTTSASVSGDLTIALSVLGDATTIQADFDNVRLTKAPAFVTVPSIGLPQAAGGNLILIGSGGTPNASYTWQKTTNLSAPVHWTTNSTGMLDNTGGFSNAIPIDHAESASFFRLRLP